VSTTLKRGGKTHFATPSNSFCLDSYFRCLLRTIQPSNGLVDSSLQLTLVGRVKLASQLVVGKGVTKVVSIRLQAVPGDDARSSSLVLGLVLFSFLHHAFDFLLRKASLVVGDRDAIRLAAGLVGSGHIENTIGIDIEGDLDLRNTTWSRGNTGESEFTEQVAVLGASSFTLVNLNEDTGLIVGVRGEDFGCFSWYCRVTRITLDKGSHDTTSSFDTQR
jgi:hypothetical protein